jgi:peptidoglycan-associated lipoprotein
LESDKAAAAAEREKAARLQEEQLKEAKAREEAARRAEEAKKEEAARRAEEAARRAEEAKKEEAARRAALDKELEASLSRKKDPGIEGEVFESRLFKDTYFDFDRYEIRLQDMPILKENAALLMKYPRMKIQVEGHCDERGTTEYNLALGQRRANSTRSYLISLGISGDRISTISYGKERPLDPGHNEQAWAKNRRAHTIILSK